MIADVNHDNTVGAVDLFCKYTLSKSRTDYVRFKITSTIDDESTDYSLSSLRYYLNNTIYNGFTDTIKNAMIPIQIIFTRRKDYSTVSISDKLKCPSLAELAFEGNGNVSRCNTPYPLFGTPQNGENNYNELVRLYSPEHTYTNYWTRDSDSYYHIYYIGCNSAGGKYFNKSYANEYGCVPAAFIRFGK